MNSTARPDQLPNLAELRAELEQGMARMLRRSAGSALPGEQILEAARSAVAGEGLPREIAKRFSESPIGTLISFDADRIHSWVFASERIQVASGASFTLDDLNGFVRERATELPGVHGVVFSAGGGGMLFAEPAANATELRRLTRAIREKLEAQTPGLTLTVVGQPLMAQDLEPAPEALPVEAEPGSPLGRFAVVRGLHGALVRMQIRVRQEKEAQPRPTLRPLAARPGTAAERCPSCNRRPPRDPPVTGDDPKHWCPWCSAMRRRTRMGFREGEDPWEREGKTLTFEDLAAASRYRRRPYLAFFAADGNGMGQLSQGLRSFLELRAFSEATSAVYEAGRNRAREVLGEGYLEDDWEPQHASPSLLSGGDEITLVLPSAPAPRVALEVLRQIERGFDEATAEGGLLAEALGAEHPVLAKLKEAGAGAGLLIAPSTYPVRLMRRYAHGLQRQAKRRCAAEGARSGIAWSLLTDGSPLPRGLEDDVEASYSPEGFARLLEDARGAKEARVPRSVLYNLLAQKRREAQGLEGVLDDRNEADRVVTLLVASFFRYQLARHPSLQTWWEALETGRKGDRASDPGSEGDAVVRWLAADGGRRLEEVTDLLSLQPFSKGTGADMGNGMETREVTG